MKAIDVLHKKNMDDTWAEMVKEARTSLSKKWKHDEWAMRTLDFQTIIYIDQNIKRPENREVPDDATEDA